ncbi:MAG: tryptophan--tRNA ligase [Candidatus Omnitrophica bacterium]|nr:tryptophan--tRNA ligase [Candidatus Omnitrophota bacterium]
MQKKVLSGMRPTGKLHLGHWVGALSNWVSLQESARCFFMVADWHALMSEYKNTYQIKDIMLDNVADWLAWGIDPEKSVIFIQSEISEHLELFMILSFLTPLGWLSRCPTFKEQIKQLKEKEINTHAFLGYPVLQAADILLYKANFVPVGEDQLPHLEITREIVRRFHFIYGKEVFVEPQPFLTKIPRFLGLDGRKMSKSYNNFIALDEDDDSIKRKVLSMFTDPQRLRRQDPGHPGICNVFSYYKVFKPELEEEVYSWCTKSIKGCKECKADLAAIIVGLVAPGRERKKKFLNDKDLVYNILKEGGRKARIFAEETLREVKKAMGLW